MTDLFWPTAPVEENEPQHPELPTQAPRRGLRTTATAAGLSALVFGGIGVGVGAAMEHGNGSPSALPAASLPSGSLSVVRRMTGTCLLTGWPLIRRHSS